MHRLKALVAFVPNPKKRTTKQRKLLEEPGETAEDEVAAPQIAGPAEENMEPSSEDSASIIFSSETESPTDQAEVLDAMPASEPDPPAPAAGLPAPAVQPEAPEVMPPTPAVQPAEPSDLAAEESAYLARMTLIQAGKHGPPPPGTHSPQQTAVPAKPDEGKACPTPTKSKSSEEPPARTPDVDRG